MEFNLQHIEFIDGSNPYICKTKKEFNKIKQKYVLDKIDNNFWKASFKIHYEVIGFSDKNKMATFNRAYTTKNGAMNFIRKSIKENKFECIMLRQNKEWLLNDDNNCVATSTPIYKYEI